MAGLNSFTGHSIVACGTMRPEVEYLQEDGFLDTAQLLYTAPGLHEDCKELKRQLLRQLEKAGSTSDRVIVLYGSRCYVDSEDMARGMDELLAEQSGDISRIDASNCVDMIASKEQREEIAAGQGVYWLTAGWLKYWKAIFKDWDAAKANETFPKYDSLIGAGRPAKGQCHALAKAAQHAGEPGHRGGRHRHRPGGGLLRLLSSSGP